VKNIIGGDIFAIDAVMAEDRLIGGTV